MRNVGSIACASEVQLGRRAAGHAVDTSEIDPGETVTFAIAAGGFDFDIARPLMFGISPTGATPGSPCHLEATRVRYVQQRLGSGGTSLTWFMVNVRNRGSAACSATALYAQPDAN